MKQTKNCKCIEEIETVCLGQVAVRGYSQPVNIYTVTELAPPGVETKAVKESES